MRVAVLVASRNRPDLVERMAGWLERNVRVDHDLFVVEAGTDADKRTPHTTVAYDDAEFRGKCFAHNIALEKARERGRRETPYDYYWVLMNDVVFDEGVDAASILIEQMEREPRLAILSPTCQDRLYPGSGRRDGDGWRAVTTCDYLGFMMRAEAVETVGFLNPSFKYCWGAIHELSHLLYASGWIVAYSDAVEYVHLGGSTYGAKATNTISREEYQRRAKRFAHSYFQRVYGPGWAEVFWQAAQGHGIEVDTYADHRRMWAEALTAEERRTPAAAGIDPDADVAVAAVGPVMAPSGPARPDRSIGPVERGVLAWPDYRNAAEIDRLLVTFGPVLASRPGLVLHLCVDPSVDPDPDEVAAVMRASHARCLANEQELQVELLEGPVAAHDWAELEGSLVASLASRRGDRRSLTEVSSGALQVSSIDELVTRLERRDAAVVGGVSRG